ncbi:hypothetical protein GUJ93_ZPchr0014g47518 [Zizania palustris]|uniref:EF-hand domain-containing protein n=1 Tax=Zizania palustris TaxID=103762 RepID=A0A8J5T9X4_ZIZPA|nr:hypothetical protein GUJ93_ZPchr0014g47518 [Zizania palustris]
MTGAARVLRGLQFLNLSIITHGWPEVEKRFERLAVYSFLLRSRFGQCIGMVGSEEFAGQIFDVLARRRGITAQLLTKNQFWEFWEQLQTFFDMVDKNADGQITEEELKERSELIIAIWPTCVFIVTGTPSSPSPLLPLIVPQHAHLVSWRLDVKL